jgi:hypothetical protein
VHVARPLLSKKKSDLIPTSSDLIDIHIAARRLRNEWVRLTEAFGEASVVAQQR